MPNKRPPLRVISNNKDDTVAEARANVVFLELSAELLDFYAGYSESTEKLDIAMQDFLFWSDEAGLDDEKDIQLHLPTLHPILCEALHAVAVQLREFKPRANKQPKASPATIKALARFIHLTAANITAWKAKRHAK